MININTNAAATAATYNLDRTNENLKRSLTRLSSGLRITPGGSGVLYHPDKNDKCQPNAHS